VNFGETSYVDGVDLTPDAFFDLLTKATTLPKTSQPTPAEFEAAYRQAGSGDSIVSVHISRKLSGTIQSAEIAQQAVRDIVQVIIVDSASASLGLGLAVVAAAEAARDGASADEVRAVAEDTARRTKVAFVVDTLEYLEKGGRIGKATAFLGTLLAVKPFLTVRDGEVHPMERVRTRRKALERLSEWAKGAKDPQRYAVMHSTTPVEAADIVDQLHAHQKDGDVMVTRFGPVVGTYLGPGAVGVGVVEGP
jgi:DegV family protein with EDD domain